ncbi:MAG TPA: sugar-binding protein [Pyrinomonadaceae bacterium]|nr:sugar-binding protein [Pyrinomonadaceae bacterium]
MRISPALKLFICLAAAALLAACAPQQTPTGSPQGPGPKRLRLAFVTNNASDYWTIARKGTEKAVQELGNVDLEFRMPGEGSAAEQKRIVDDLLAKGIDGMAISPVDPANQTQMINDAARQILVLTQDSDAPESQRACYIGTDNRAAGRQAGELVRQTLPQGGKIMVFVGKADAQNARERFEGMKEALAGSNVEVIDLRTDDADRVRAKSNAADTLVRYPEVSAMVGLWAYNGPAILSALRDAGKVGQVKVIAFDEEDDTLKGIQEGAIEGTVVQQPYEFGYQSIKAMSQIIGGDRSIIPASKQVFVPTKVIKKDTVEEFIKQLNQLRGRA